MSDLQKFIEDNGGYWEGECPSYPWSVWRDEVFQGNTRMGYWEWAYNSKEGDE